ncbi:exosortase X [Rhodocaloribacter sp.]
MRPFFRHHRAIIVFFAKMLAAYAVWFALYDLWLLPDGRLDEMLSLHAASASRSVLSWLGYEASVFGRVVWMDGTAGIEVVNGCNGLAVIGLFLGFVLAFPGVARRRLVFLPLGILALYLVNVGRLAFLVLVQQYRPEWFDLVHQFAATGIYYVVVFGLWVAWAHLGAAKKAARPEAVRMTAVSA